MRARAQKVTPLKNTTVKTESSIASTPSIIEQRDALTADIESLEAAIKNLKVQRETLKSEIEAKDAAIETIKAKRNKLNDDYLLEADKKKKELEDQLKQLRQDTGRLRISRSTRQRHAEKKKDEAKAAEGQ